MSQIDVFILVIETKVAHGYILRATLINIITNSTSSPLPDIIPKKSPSSEGDTPFYFNLNSFSTMTFPL